MPQQYQHSRYSLKQFARLPLRDYARDKGRTEGFEKVKKAHLAHVLEGIGDVGLLRDVNQHAGVVGANLVHQHRAGVDEGDNGVAGLNQRSVLENESVMGVGSIWSDSGGGAGEVVRRGGRAC